MKNHYVFLAVTTAFVVLAGCAPQQYVQGAYSTPNKRATGAIVGATGAAIVTGFSSGTAVGVGGMAGEVAGHNLSRRSLVQNINEQGAQAIVRGDTLRIVIPADELFEENSVTLNPARYRLLDYVAALLKEYGNTPIWVEGHADNIGTREQARVQTLQQARSVVTYLWVHGIAFDHLYAVGRGRSQAIADSSTSQGSAYNRRVEIILRDGCPNPSLC